MHDDVLTSFFLEDSRHGLHLPAQKCVGCF